MKHYLSFIRKADFTDLFKYGKLHVNGDTTITFDCEVNKLQDNPVIFDELVKNTNSFDSSFVYLIIHYQKNDNDNPCDVNIEDLCHIFPLDRAALHTTLWRFARPPSRPHPNRLASMR